MDYLLGLVERITYINEENGFSVIKIKAKGFPDLVIVVGNLVSVNVGAISTAALSKFMVLTGGPGTGKSTITLAIIQTGTKSENTG